MDKKENLKSMYVRIQDAVKKLLDDVTEEESNNPVKGLCCPIKWQTGHIAFYVDYTVKLLGGESILPEKWVELYRGGVELSDEHSAYKPFSEMRKELYSLYDSFNSQLEKTTDKFLDEEVEFSPEYKATRMDGILMLATHEFYHAGQITVARNNLGRERPFG
jgi:uncharacterized damage-inducible protein DinB